MDLNAIAASIGVEWVEGGFRLVPRMSAFRYGRQLQTQELFRAYWALKLTTHPLDSNQARRFRVFLDRAIQGVRFTMHDPEQPYPANHPAASISGAWSDTLSVTSLTTTTFSVSGANNNLRMLEGDLVGLEQSGKQTLHRLTATPANPVAGAMTMAVTPYIPSGIFTAGATCRIGLPAAQFLMDPSQDIDTSRVGAPTGYTFTAVEAII